MTAEERTHYRTCHLCEAICGIEIRVRGTEILSIRGDDADPFSRGHICPKAVAIKDIHEDPDRLRHPVRRHGDGWQRMSWDEALDEVASRLVDVQARHGKDSVATYFGNPQVHSYTALLGGTLFARSLRTYNRYTATSVDQLPHHFAAYFMYGHQLLIPVADLDRTQFLLAIGANPVVSNGSLMTAPDVANRLKAIRHRGGRVVVIDPRHTETAKLADEHHFIRPGSDALFLLALLHVIFREGLARPGRLQSVANGMEQIERLCADYPPERVDAVTGIADEQVRRLADAGPAREEVDVVDHITADRDSVGGPEVDDLPGGVAGRVDDTEPRHLVTLGEHATDRMGRALPEARDQPVDRVTGVRRLHRRAPLHRGDVGLVAGERHAPGLADVLCHSLVVGVAVGERDERQRPVLDLAEDPAPGQLRRCVDQHVADQVDVDRVVEPAQLKDLWSQLLDADNLAPHAGLPTLGPGLGQPYSGLPGPGPRGSPLLSASSVRRLT